ncbi:hypothetical protein Anas_03507 [Armadillidium nasatum]|uniref:Uncharacterized protein n=1 Tax=Armadillidium nasatum TaxID=96803 RepID=A0A5N5SXJ8_9CRUS|nr:hypothetical protein Anas_03507 [Armadillidium nasatum]
MVKLKQQEPQTSPRNSQDSNEFVQERKIKKSEGDSLFSGLLKNRPKYKLRKMTNKELGEAVEQEMNLLEQMRNLLEEQEKPNSNSEETDSTSKAGELDKNAKELKKNRMFNEKGKCSSKQRNCVSRKKTSKALNSITYEDFGNDFELLKECFVECLQCSYIESARTLLPYHLELFEKQKSYQSNFQEEKIVEHMIKMINYYSSPSMMRSMQQKIRKYKKNRNCEEKETSCDKSDSKNLPKKKNTKVEKDNESNNADTSVNILECEIDIVIEGKSKNNPHLESESLEDFQGRENCINETKISSIDKLNLTTRNKIKEKENKIENSSRFKSNVTTPFKAKHCNESDNNNLSVYSPKNKKRCRNEDHIQTVEKDLNRTPEMSKSFAQADEDDEYCLIERQLAALDGSVINSPSIRAELTSNTMDDNNISVMFTPSNQVSEENIYFPTISEISKEILPTLSPVKMMSFTPLPGTPVKRVEEICQSVVKNKVALVAIPSQSFGNNNSSLNIMADLEVTEDSYSMGAVSVEKDVYLSDENSQHENSVYTLSFSEYLDIFSLNLSPKNIKRQRIDKAKTKNKKNCKNVSENKKVVGKRKYSKLKEDKSNSSIQKGRPSIQSSKKCKKVNKEGKIGSLDSSVTSKSKRSPQSQSSARKLNFVSAKRKREEVGETRHAKIRKLAKFTDDIQTNNGQGTKQKPNSSLKSIPNTDDMVLEKQTSENVPKDIYKTTESDIHSNNKDTLDDSESLVELHLSSSDSDSNQDSPARTSKKSPRPENISSSLLKGGSFELSTTPNKLQTVISKFPNQDNYIDESYFSIPPTPGKHLFLPESNKITDTNTNQMNLNTYALGESSYNNNVKSCDVPPHTSQEKRKSSSKVTKSRRQKGSPKNQSNSSKKSKKSSSCSENSSDKSTNIATKDIFSKLKGLFGESFSSDENIPSLKGQKKYLHC